MEINFRKEAEKYKSAMLEDISSWIQIPSVTGTPEAIQALDWMLVKGKKDGGKIARTDLDGAKVAGHVHFGNEDEFIGILGHVDVVPVNKSEWTFWPWGGEIKDGYIQGRGTQDDKGPTMMAYYAYKMLVDLGLPMSKGVRFILGTQEEGGDWTDIDNYFKHHKTPVMGFTPDADFPLIFAEKAILRATLKGQINCDTNFIMNGGSVVNSVPDKATVEINGEHHVFNGKAAHAKDAHKAMDSAIWKAFKFLASKTEDPIVKWVNENLVQDPTLSRLGIGYETQEEGPLTCNMGVVSIDAAGNFELKLDMRLPVGKEHDQVIEELQAAIDKAGVAIKVVVATKSARLYASKDSDLIKSLEGAYRKYAPKGFENEPLRTTGGGTYAKCMPNCVAFGPLFPEDERRLHQKDERANIANMMDAVAIYAEAIYNLCK